MLSTCTPGMRRARVAFGLFGLCLGNLLWAGDTSALMRESLAQNRQLQAVISGQATLPAAKTMTPHQKHQDARRRLQLQRLAEHSEAARKALRVEAQLEGLIRFGRKQLIQRSAEPQGPTLYMADANAWGASCERALELGDQRGQQIALGSKGSANDHVWLRWQAPAEGNYLLQTYGSDIDSQLTAYESCAASGRPLASNDDSLGLAAALAVRAEYPGQTWLIKASNLASPGKLQIKGELGVLISGRVTGEDSGESLFDVAVQAFSNATHASLAYAYTDTDGRYELALTHSPDDAGYLVRTGRGSDGYRVLHEAWEDVPCQDDSPSYIDACIGAGVLELAAGESRSDIDFALGTGAVLTGLVTDAGTGQPLADARVRLIVDGVVQRYEDADALGRYRFVGMYPGRYLVHAGSPESFGQLHDGVACPVLDGCNFALGTPVELHRASAEKIDFALQPRSFLDVSIDVDGAPAIGDLDSSYSARFTMFRPDGVEIGTLYRWLGDNRFRIGPLEPGAYLLRGVLERVTFAQLYSGVDCADDCMAELSEAQPISIETSGDRPQVRLNLRTLPVIRGTVRATDSGQPLAGAILQIYKWDNPENPLAWVQSDESGQYEINTESPDSYFVTASAPTFVDAIHPNIPCESEHPLSDCLAAESVLVGLDSGDVIVDFSLRAAARLHGRLTADGLPLPMGVGLTPDAIRLLLPDRQELQRTTLFIDSNSNYVLSDYPPGNYLLGAGVTDYYAQLWPALHCPGDLFARFSQCDFVAATTIELGLADEPSSFDFELMSHGARTVQLRHERSGAVLPGISLDLWDRLGRSVGAIRTDQNGRARLRAPYSFLPAESYRLSTDNYQGLNDEVYADQVCAAGTSVFKGSCSLAGATPIELPNTDPLAPVIRIDLGVSNPLEVFFSGFE